MAEKTLPAPDPRAPYYLAEYGRDLGKPMLMRHNDGSLVIMQRGRDETAEDNRPALIVPRVAPVKRSEAWKADDPAQEAFAREVLRLLNEQAGDQPFEVYWTDGRGEDRGVKLNSLGLARGFIMGLRKDPRNRSIYGARAGYGEFNFDEDGEPWPAGEPA